MSRKTWRYVALAGFITLACAAALGPTALRVAFLFSCVTAFISITVSIRHYKPMRPEAWYGLAGAALCFFVSDALRIGIPSFSPQPSGNPVPPDFIDALAYFCAIFSIHRLGQVRDRDKDPTTIIDALIVAGGVSTIMWVVGVVPYMSDTKLNIAGRVLGVSLAVFSTWLAFGAARLAIGPGLRSATSKLLLGSALFAVLGETATTADADPLARPVLFFGACAGFLLATAAAHFDMTRLTEAASRPVGAMTRGRLAAMTIALLIAPTVILIRVGADSDSRLLYFGLIASWAVVIILVMIRLAGLVRARERIGMIDRALARAAAALVVATDREATYAAALVAMKEIVGDESGVRVSLLLADDEQWTVVDSAGAQAEDARGRTISASLMLAVLDRNPGKAVQLLSALTLDSPSAGTATVVAAPLLSQRGLRGALMVSAPEPLRQVTVDALESLSGDVSLAIEAVGLAEDLHERRSQQRFEVLVRHSSDLTAVLTTDGTLSYVSPAIATILGIEPADAIDKPLSDFIHPDDFTIVSELAGLLVSGQTVAKHAEVRMQHTDTSWKTLDVTLTDVRHEDSVDGIVMNAHDITEQKALENDLRHKVLHDDLTGIANRVLFRDRVQHALNSARAQEMVTAVLFIDIDDFKTVNDGLGHDVGDELLKVIGFRMESFVRAGDTAARLGGDEFAILLEDLYSLDDVMNAAQRLLVILSQPIEFGRREINVSASIGIALAEDGATSEVLLRNADVAMYHAKQTGKNRVRLFDEAMHVSAFERLEMKGELTHALERRELSLHYQPLIQANTGRLVGFEALMRWTHPTLGFVSPASFIPLAEETGLIVEIGAWALEEALSQLAVWRNEFRQDVGMSVNVSPRQLEEARIVDDVQNAIRISGVDPAWITLELTESAGLDDNAKQDRLLALRQLGCEIAADDFGTGFASYAALQQLPFTNVKIDRSLITGLSSGDQKAHAQVKSIIQMGHALGLTITAEGIEDSRQADSLAVMGADKFQGYLFGRPSPSAEAAELFRNTSVNN